jgi:hypothetical protein
VYLLRGGVNLKWRESRGKNRKGISNVHLKRQAISICT